MVIAHHRVDAEGARERDLAMAHPAAVDGDHHPGTGLRQTAHARLAHAVSITQPMRDVQDGLVAQRAQEPHQDGAAADAVDIVVAVDADALAATQGSDDALGRRRHLAEQHRRAQVFRQPCVEKRAGMLRRADAAPDEQSRQQRREAERAAQKRLRLGLPRAETPASRHDDYFRRVVPGSIHSTMGLAM